MTKRVSGWLHTRVSDALYELPVTAVTRAAAATGCRILSTDDSSLLRTNFKTEKAADFLTRLSDSVGIVCLADDGAIAGYVWATDQSRSHEGDYPFYYRIVPGKGDLYIYDLFVRPEYRSKGVATRLMNAVTSFAVTRGYHRCFTLHDIGNSAMIKISEGIGFRRIGCLTYRRIGPWITRDTTALYARGG
jgi:GNAT superfamily N-acetyltransferase